VVSADSRLLMQSACSSWVYLIGSEGYTLAVARTRSWTGVSVALGCLAISH
jgi:hypothetical protein